MGFLDFNRARRRRGLLPDSTESEEAARPAIGYNALTAMGGPAIRPRVVDPAQDSGEAPDVVDVGSSAQQVRPRIVDEPSYYLNRYKQVENMPNYETPGWKSRIGDTLQAAGEALMQPARTQAESISNVAQALSSATLLDPHIARERRRQRELQKIGGQYQTTEAQREAKLKHAKGIADYNKTVAETDRLVHPKPDVQLVKGKGGWFAVDKNDIGSKPTRLPIDPDSPDTPPRQFEHMGVRYETVKDDTGKWVTRAVEGLPTDESAVPVPYKPTADSPTFMVRPADAVRGATEIEGANINAGAKAGEYQTDAANANSQREWDAAKSQIDRDNQVTKDRYARAEVDTKALRDAITAAATKAALANNPPPHRAGDKIYDAAPEDVARYKDEAKAAVAKVHALAATVRQNYPDLVSDDELSWPTVLKAAPEPKAYPTPPKVQARPAPAKRTGGPVAEPPISETDFLAHAKSQMGDAYDEGKARAAYRKRYGR